MCGDQRHYRIRSFSDFGILLDFTVPAAMVNILRHLEKFRSLTERLNREPRFLLCKYFGPVQKEVKEIL